MKMRFWRKIYIFTLVLFLFCLNAGILIPAYYTYNKSVKAEEDSCRAEQSYIGENFERDYNDIQSEGKGESPFLLMKHYGENQHNTLLAFIEDGSVVFSSFPEYFEFPAVNKPVHKKLNGIRYIIITGKVCEGKYTLIYGKSVESLDEDFKTFILTYSATAAGISVFLALCLFFILKKLSVPLEKLRIATEKISEGDTSVTADESGNDELSLLAKSFNSMVHKINEQMKDLETTAKQKQSLVDNMAHELRTPLTAIRGYAEYLEKAAISEEERIDSAKYIVSEAKRLQKVSEILLDIAYIKNIGNIEKYQVDLVMLLNKVASELKQKADNQGVEIRCELDKSAVTGDEILLNMLFYNLTENAIKACDKGGRVTLKCRGLNAMVIDNGKGIPQTELDNIMEPFYRVDRSCSRPEGGVGLGLPLCRQIAIILDAEIRFESEIGSGTTVFVDFTS